MSPGWQAYSSFGREPRRPGTARCSSWPTGSAWAES